MLTLGMFHLTHPEVLSEAELREILENSCIDFSSYEHFSRSQLIELYKRVAMPLPRRELEGTQNSDTKKNNEERSSANESHTNSVSMSSMNDTSKNINGMKPLQTPYSTKSKSPTTDVRCTSKKIHLYNSNNNNHCRSVDKRLNSEKLDETPLRKRQKITWP